MLHYLSDLTANGADVFALTALRFPDEIVPFITRCPATSAHAPAPVVLWRPGLPADPAHTLAEIPIMALVSRLPALRAFAAIPLMTK
jgi:hypothetical protein